MVEMYSRINDLCKAKGTNVTAMCRELDIARSSLSELNRGRTKSLSYEYISKIANYFDVSPDYIAGKTDIKEKAPILTEKDERDISKRLDQTLSDLENAQGALMFDGEPLDDVTKELLIASLKKDLEMGKRIAKQKFTPKKYRKPE